MRVTLIELRSGPIEHARTNGYSTTGAEALRAAPGLARLAAGMWWRAAGWTLSTSTRGASRVGRAALSGESATELLEVARSELSKAVRTLLGSDDGDPSAQGAAAANGHSEDTADVLRERLATLLDTSADVEHEQDIHPAYERIVEELAPDEARILRLLATEGDQAAIDIKTRRPFGVGSETVAPGITMVAARAGARHGDRTPAYLNNLFRLGLIWFSHEPLDDLSAYQVLEAQPETAEAWEQAGRARSVRRSIRLTAFGRDFCEHALPAPDVSALRGASRTRPRPRAS